VVIHIADKGCGKNRCNHPQHGFLAKVANISRKEKKLHHQFFKVVVIAIPKIDDGFRQKRLIGIAKNVEAKKTQCADPDMASGSKKKCLPDKLQIKADPSDQQRGRVMTEQDLLEPRDA